MESDGFGGQAFGISVAGDVSGAGENPTFAKAIGIAESLQRGTRPTARDGQISGSL